jgi:DNA repair exonuclease SbcCD ATPase subunit
MPTETCPACSKPLVKDGDFCPSCGIRIASSTIAANHSYIQSQLNLELSKRLRDQKSVVREIADQAEDVVWKRIQRYTILFSLLAFILGATAFFGITTGNDVSKRIEPIIQDAEKRAKEARKTIDETASKVDSVKASLDQLAIDVTVQTKRVAEKNLEVNMTLSTLDAATQRAKDNTDAFLMRSDELNQSLQTYQVRSDALSKRLDATEKALETKVEQISKQIDDVSIRRSYPGLGEKLFVTLDGNRWKGKSAKGPNEKWVSISVDPFALSDFSPGQFEQLMAELKAHSYTPILGTFGVGGPYK